MFVDRHHIAEERVLSDERLIAGLSGGDEHKAAVLRSILGTNGFDA